MTQKTFLKATGVFLERVLWALMMTVVVMAKLIFRAVTSGPGSSEGQEAQADPYSTPEFRDHVRRYYYD